MTLTMLSRALATTLATMLSAPLAHAADQLRIEASHDLAIARASETITVPWTEVNRALPGALIQRLAVRDRSGRVLAHQVTNVLPQAKDPLNIGAAYGELIFQYSFGPGEKSASFTVEKIESLAPVFPTAVTARYIQERLDDFAWENDLLAHRTYGPALGAPAAPGVVKEVLASSGLDIWFKRVSYPVVERWYNKGHDHYHKDEGEGMDMYNVGKSRGCGGSGVWDGKQLYTSHNYTSWKVLANGPVRAIFELSYDSWDAGGVAVSELKRFTVDAGHQFDRIDSTFTFASPAALTVAIGLNKNPADKGQKPLIASTRDESRGALMQWVQQASHGAFGTAIVVPGASGYAQDTLNELVLAKVASGQPLRYYVGAAWDKAGRVANAQQWNAEIATQAARVANPVRLSLSTVTFKDKQ
jgi:pectinesterase